MLWAIYLALVPIVTIWAMIAGWRSDRPELTRCGAVVLGHASIVQLGMVISPPVAGQGYPFIFLTLALVGALWLICRIPAGRHNALLAGGVLFGILSTLVYGVSVTLDGNSVHADWSYFAAQFTMGWANLLFLLGWTHERNLSRIVDRCFGAFARLVRFAHIGGVAR